MNGRLRIERATRTAMAWVGLAIMAFSFVRLVSMPLPERLIAKASATRGSVGAVILDPGHGGQDSGAMCGTILEKDLTLDLAQRTARLLKAEGITTLMTRSDDTFVSLSDRARFTNQLRDCILVSIHFNDTQRALATGVETYYAEHQNAPVPMLMRWIPFVSKGSPAGPANIESQSLAGLIQEAVVTRTHALDRGAKPRQFYVISNVTHPAVLVEGGFLSNKEDVTKLANTEYRDQLATAIAEGIMRYRELVKERQTTLAVTTGAGR